jgi:hypothetical protein
MMGKYIHLKSVERLFYFFLEKRVVIKSNGIHPNRNRTKRGTRNLHRLSNDIFQERTKGGFIHGKQNDEGKKGGKYILPYQTKLLPFWHLDHQTLKY